jgi:DNA-directed RNA polymerase subunit alpha
MKPPKNFQDESYSIDAVFMPVRNANHNVHSYGNGNENSQLKKKRKNESIRLTRDPGHKTRTTQ